MSAPKADALPLGDTPSLISRIAYVDGIIAPNNTHVKSFCKKSENFLKKLKSEVLIAIILGTYIV